MTPRKVYCWSKLKNLIFLKLHQFKQKYAKIFEQFKMGTFMVESLGKGARKRLQLKQQSIKYYKIYKSCDSVVTYPVYVDIDV